MKKIILISGKAGSGKDTLAKEIKKYLEKNNSVVITHFASHIKNILKEYYNWNEIKDDWARNKLQTIGTDIIRIRMNLPDFHVKRTCENIEIVEDDFDYFIIPDTRFENEIKYPTYKFGTSSVIKIRVEREGYQSELTKEAQNHASEISLDNYNNWDYIAKSKDLNDVAYHAKNICINLLNENIYK